MTESSRENEAGRIKIDAPSIRNAKDEALWKDVQKYVRMIPDEAEPSLGRVREIKEEIKKGTYLKKEMLDQTAARMAARLCRPQHFPL